jgi:AcrR family transcriptional regulator
VRKTKKALREGLSILMEQKSIWDISVRELSEMVDLNRATFYLHYKDVNDLLQQIEDEVIAEADEILAHFTPTGDSDQPYELYLRLFLYIAENAKLVKMLVNKTGSRTFFDKFCFIVEERCIRSWMEVRLPSTTEDETAYLSRYMVYGFVSIMEKWVSSDMEKTPVEMAAMMGTIMKNIGYYGEIFWGKDK